MPVLQPSEYDISYFDGTHPAGYSSYKRWYRKDSPTSLGEFWKDYAANWINHLAISGKKVLELGCAKGFIVKDLRDMGVDAYGIDVSQYAIDNCEPEVAPYLTVGDVRTSLAAYSNKEFDAVFTLGLIECLTDSEAIALATQAKRIGKKVYFVIWTEAPTAYYNSKTLQAWKAILPNQITLVNHLTLEELVT